MLRKDFINPLEYTSLNKILTQHSAVEAEIDCPPEDTKDTDEEKIVDDA